MFARRATRLCQLVGNGNVLNAHASAAVRPTQARLVLTKSRHLSTVAAHSGDIAVREFRELAFTPETPFCLKQHHRLADGLFLSREEDSARPSQLLLEHPGCRVQFELMSPQWSSSDSQDKTQDIVRNFHEWLVNKSDPLTTLTSGLLAPIGQSDATFLHFQGPLDLLFKALEFNKDKSIDSRIKQLYIAQSSLDELPEQLKKYLAIPSLVQAAGKGDVYASSLWMGLEPTYTPLHRDPNPNLFCQVISNKAIRLLPPKLGLRLYTGIQEKLGRNGNSRFRGNEMMEGPERRLLANAVWDVPQSEIQEAVLERGDSLFIPKGWWHSVKSLNSDGHLNASVNWWFR